MLKHLKINKINTRFVGGPLKMCEHMSPRRLKAPSDAHPLPRLQKPAAQRFSHAPREPCQPSFSSQPFRRSRLLALAAALDACRFFCCPPALSAFRPRISYSILFCRVLEPALTKHSILYCATYCATRCTISRQERSGNMSKYFFYIFNEGYWRFYIFLVS